MTTTHAFRQALHIPWADPDMNEIVAAVVPGAEYSTDWILAAGTPEAPVDGKQYGRQSAGWTEVTWTSIPGKPVSFPPSAHSHPWGEITEKPTTFPPSAHGHLQSEVSGLVATLDAKAPLASPIFTGAPKAPSPVSTSSSDTSIATTLWVQQVLDIYYQMGEVDPLLAAKEDKAKKGVASGYAPLDANSKLPVVHLPDQIATDLAARVLKAGDTMTGPLVLPADPATAMQAATKQYVDAASGGSISDVPLDGIRYVRKDRAWVEVSIDCGTY